MSRRKSIPADGAKENPEKDNGFDEPMYDEQPVQGTEEVALSTFDVAAEHIMQAKTQMHLALGFIPDSREKSVAITNFDTALLWLAEALNVAKRNAEIAQQRVEEMKNRPKYL